MLQHRRRETALRASSLEPRLDARKRHRQHLTRLPHGQALLRSRARNEHRSLPPRQIGAHEAPSPQLVERHLRRRNQWDSGRRHRGWEE